MSVAVATKAEVTRTLQSIGHLARELGVARLGLFGSFRRETASAESDIDLLVEFEPGEKTFLHLIGLSDLLESRLGRPVDLVTRESLSPYIRQHVLRDVEYVRLTDAIT